MNSDLNDHLKGALGPVDPGEKFTQRVMARVANASTSGVQATGDEEAWAQGHGHAGEWLARRRWLARGWWLARGRWLAWSPASGWVGGALLVSVVASVLVVHEWQVRRTQQGLEARAQLIEALKVTGENLDLAYRAVNDAARSPPGGNSGA